MIHCIINIQIIKKKVKYLKKQVNLNEAQLDYFEHKLKSWKQKYDYLIWVKNNSK
jgi:hypothetical protein